MNVRCLVSHLHCVIYYDCLFCLDMDHPADVIIHGRGNTIAQAFEQVCIGMMNYMVPLQYVEIVPETEREVEVQGLKLFECVGWIPTASGHDLENLLYTFLDEFFFIFSTDLFISKEVEILKLDESNFSIKAIG